MEASSAGLVLVLTGICLLSDKEVACGTHMNFEARNLSAIPSIPNDTIEADFSSNVITEIGELELSQAEELLVLTLDNNQISHVHPNAFDGTLKLSKLSLQRNSLEELPVLGAVADTLTDLDVSTNLIHTVDNDYFATFSSLVNLDLSGNPLRAIRPMQFRGLVNLRRLSLLSNDISSIDCTDSWSLVSVVSVDMSKNMLDAFPCVANWNKGTLKTMRLDSNQIHHIQDHSLQSVVSITNLSIQFNQLSDIDFVVMLPDLQELALDVNPIAYINGTYLNNLIHLRNFSLTYDKNLTSINFLQHLPLLSYLNLIQIPHLQLRDDPFLFSINLTNVVITNSDIDTFPVLHNSTSIVKELHLSGNNISCIDVDHVYGMTNLTLLYLDYNKLQRFPDAGCADNMSSNDPFTIKFPNLKKINLDNNEIYIFPILGGMPSGSRVCLNHNNLTLFPANHTSRLAKVSYLEMSHNDAVEFPNFSQLQRDNCLRLIDLRWNNISTIPFDYIETLESLVELKISHNSILTLDTMTLEAGRMWSFWHLDVSYNLIEAISPALLQQMHLITFRARRNLLRTFPRLDSMGSPLNLVDCSENNIVNIPTGTIARLTEVRKIYLSFNEIRSFPFLELEKTAKLRTLDLSNNALTTMDDISTFVFGGLTIDITANRFLCDYNLCWLRNFSMAIVTREEELCSAPAGLVYRVLALIDDEELGCYEGFVRIYRRGQRSRFAQDPTVLTHGTHYRGMRLHSTDDCLLKCHEDPRCDLLTHYYYSPAGGEENCFFAEA